MSKVAHYLQEHLLGEVMTSTDARRYFATDGSILQLAPALIAYPRNENDVRKTARFTWQLAERGRVIPITPRGSGSDQSGAALGSGIMLVFPAHLNRILELDTKSNTVIVEPGINYGKLQQTLQTHGRFLPPYPASLEYSTVGGAIANNASGDRSLKYGDTYTCVRSLRVVLANGEVIETGRLSKRELSKKLGLATFEGEIYRSLDTLIEENHDLVAKLQRNVTMNVAGYNLGDVKHRDGSFDLTPLIVGSQGSLGIVTEAVLETEAHNPEVALLVAQFDSVENLERAVLALRKLSELPASMELIDDSLLAQVHKLNPNQLKDVAPQPYAKFTLLVEFDSAERKIKKLVKKAGKILDQHAQDYQVTTDSEEQQKLWKLRQATAAVLAHNEGQQYSLPIANAAVPIDRLREYIEGVSDVFKSTGVQSGLWGHAGDGNLLFQPRANLAQVGDRQKLFKILDEYHKLVIKLGGTIAASSGEGRLRAPYLESMYGTEAYGLLKKVKQIFDPYGTMNPGVKIGTSLDDVKAMIRSDFGVEHLYTHLPRS